MRRLSERLNCPEDLQQYLTDLFGVNRFGDALFRIIWGQTEIMQVATKYGYEDRLIGNNQPCWILQKWNPPEMYGTPGIYYALMADPETGLAMLGEYPEFGRYETLVMFQSKHYDAATKELIIETIPLDWAMIGRVIPALIASQEMTYWEKRAALEAQEAWENAQIVSEIADRLHSDLPTFYGPTSYVHQANRTSLIDRKKAEIERKWKEFNLRREPARGFYQGEPN